MKGKKILERIVVSVLILALTLSNVSVAADNQNAIQTQEVQNPDTKADSGPEDHASNPGRSQESDGAGGDVFSVSSESGDANPADTGSDHTEQEQSGQEDSGQAATGSEDVSQDTSGTENGGPDGSEDNQNVTDTDGNLSDTSGTEDGNPDELDADHDNQDGPNADNGSDTPDTGDDNPDTEGPSAGDTNPETPDTEDQPATPSEEDQPADTDQENKQPETSEQNPDAELQNPDVPIVEPEEKEAEEEDPLDFSGMIPLEELTGLPEDEVGFTMWESEISSGRMFRARARNSWSFDSYYVNQGDSQYDVTMEKDFNLKYQMEFHTDQTLFKGALMIKIEKNLLTDRDGNLVMPDDIGVSEGDPSESGSGQALFKYFTVEDEPVMVPILDENGEMVTDEDGSPVMEQLTEPVTDAEGNTVEVPVYKDYLVFYNCRSIPAGTNAAWQVLYKNKKIMDLTGGSEWMLTPQIYVDPDAGTMQEEGNDAEPLPAKNYEEVMKLGPDGFSSDTRQSLTGRIKSGVSLTSVIKTPWQEPGSNYTPGLYTVAQLNQYIEGKLPEDSPYIDQDNPSRLSSDWRFVVWDVKVKGTATQPWDLYIVDEPTMDGAENDKTPAVVGYRDNSDRRSVYALPISAPDPEDQEGASSKNQRESSWGSRFYVVTAYPAEQVQEGTPLYNRITVKLHPVDHTDDAEDAILMSSLSTWNYKDYDWTYSGNVIGVHKSTDEQIYTGWLDAYKSARNQGDDYGDLPYKTQSVMYGYSSTHETSGSDVGVYRDGTYYTLTTTDDYLYAHFTADGTVDGALTSKLLSEEDYYFSNVSIRQRDYGYDVWEDKRADSDLQKIDAGRLPQGIFHGADGAVQSPVRIWAKFAEPGAGLGSPADGWYLVDTVYLDGTGRMESYTFGADLIAQKPYRIKVEHDSIDYQSECEIDVNVRLRAGSPVMGEVIAARQDAGRNIVSPVVQIENLSGTIGVSHDASGREVWYDHSSGQIQNDNKDFQYGIYDSGTDSLEELTKTAYDNHLLVRDNAYRKLTWLIETADSAKTAKSRNDVANSRVQVDYCLTAYDGYEIYDKSCLDYLTGMGAEGLVREDLHRSNVVFYDLLPHGMSFDASVPVTAGRITNLDENRNYESRPNTWDPTQVTVDSSEIVPDYRGTGRTLVVFRIAYSGADATSYTAGKWIEGWGVSFRAYYDWKDTDVINENLINANLSAFMPDFKTNDSNNSHPGLHGLSTEVYKDNGELGGVLAATYEDLVREPEGGQRGNIDGIDTFDNIPHVLYAHNVLKDDVAVSTQNKIQTLVRADANRLGTFSESAVIPKDSNQKEDGYYTYEITVSTASNMKHVVIYDRLENAAVDRKEVQGEPFTFGENPWHGTFQSLDLGGLTKLGIEPVVYYNSQRDAKIPAGDEDPAQILTEANGWYPEEVFLEKFGKDQVLAVAVDLGRQQPDKDGNTEFILQSNHSVSFEIRMKAPDVSNAMDRYTFNNASFSSVSAGTNTKATVTGNSVRVGLSLPEKLEVVKRFGGDVPSSLRDTTFAFRLYESYDYQVYDPDTGKTITETREQPLAYKEYRLIQADGTAVENRATATDGDGYLHLHADEKAVFELADAERIQVKETESIFWKTEESTEKSKEEDMDVRTVTVTNTYRPVLYVEKELSGVPKGAKTPEELAACEFEFQILLKGAGGEYDKPLADAEYWYVDSARLDGGLPKRLRSGTTDEEGRFRLRQGEIIALFPGVAGAEYKLVETEPGTDWICTESEQTGKLSLRGDSKTFVNYYKWKDLYLSKQIENQLPEDYDQMTSFTDEEGRTIDPREFTFRVELITDGTEEGAKEFRSKVQARRATGRDQEPVTQSGEKTGEAPKAENLNSADAGKNTSAAATFGTKPVTGLTWVLLDGQGNEVQGTHDAEGNLQTGGNYDADGNQVRGILDNNGEFSCALGFRTVRIRGLAAEQSYLIREMTGEIAEDPATGEPLYIPKNDTAEVKMPVFSDSKSAEIVNTYQRCSLSVTKTVVEGTKAEGTDGREIPAENVSPEAGTDSGESYEFLLLLETRGEQMTPVGNFAYTVAKTGVEDRSGITGPDGTFTLKAGETARFPYVGMRGYEFRVYEKTDDSLQYQQVYPSEGMSEADRAGYGVPYAGTLKDAENSAFFINGAAGNLYISKEYVAAGEGEKAYVESLQELIRNSVLRIFDEGDRDFPEDEQRDGWGLYRLPGEDDAINSYREIKYARMTLEITEADGTSYSWPTESTEVRLMNYLVSGREETITLQPGVPIKVYPWTAIVVPLESIGEGASYTLKEEAAYQHEIVEWQREEQVVADDDTKVYLEISQSEPAEDRALTGKVSENPNAVIRNQVKTVESDGNQTWIGKEMTGGSEKIPLGAKLVWRLEQYKDGSWGPAPEIPYMTFAATTNIFGVTGQVPISDRVLETGEDGKITLIQSEFPFIEKNMPRVWFPKNKVYLNLYNKDDIDSLLSEGGEPLLRLVEVPEESDEVWGRLTAYGYIPNSGPEGSAGSSFKSSLDAPPTANLFVNSNQPSAVQVAKEMTDGMGAPDEPFTMILRQVLSMGGENTPGAGGGNAGGNPVIASEPRSGISYTTYDADNVQTGRGYTGPGGEFQVFAGQYAVLNLPMGTVWTVEEDLNAVPNYTLASLDPRPGNEQLTWLSENLMLITMIERENYKVRWYEIPTDEYGNATVDGDWKPTSKDLIKEETRTGTVGEVVSIISELEPDGYWYDSSDPISAAIASAVLNGSGKTELWVYLKEKTYGITYDNTGGSLSGIDRSWPVKKGVTTTVKMKTPQWPDSSKVFTGWNTSPDGTGRTYQPGDELIMPKGGITLYAMWEEQKMISLRFQFEGIDESDIIIPSNLSGSLQSPTDILYKIGKNEKKNIPYYPNGKYILTLRNYKVAGYDVKISTNILNADVSGNTVTFDTSEPPETYEWIITLKYEYKGKSRD